MGNTPIVYLYFTGKRYIIGANAVYYSILLSDFHSKIHMSFHLAHRSIPLFRGLAPIGLLVYIISFHPLFIKIILKKASESLLSGYFDRLILTIPKTKRQQTAREFDN